MIDQSFLKIKRKELCKNCLKPEKYYGPFKDGLCSTCRGEDIWGQTLTESEKNELSKLTDELLINASKKGIPIAIGLSGGKDSTYLVKRIIQKFDELGIQNKIICITVRIPTESKNLVPNINNFKKIVKELNLPVEFYEIRPSFDMYKFYLDIILTDKIIIDIQRTYDTCNLCSDLLESLVIKKAIELGSNLIFFGLSPDESNRFIGKIPDEKLSHNWFPEILNDVLDPKVKDDFYSPKWGTVKVLFPFHYWDYDENAARNESKQYIKESDPFKTNCSMVFLNMVLDLYTVGKMGYIESYSHLVRTGAMSKSDGITYLNTFLSLIKNRQSFIWTEHINPILEKFNLSFEDLVDKRKKIIDSIS